MLSGNFLVKTGGVELSNGTKLGEAPVYVEFVYELPNLERGIGTIELLDVEPDNVDAKANVYLEKPYFDELWKQVRKGGYTECDLMISVAPVLRKGTLSIWNVSERQSLFILNATISFARRLP